MKKQTCNPKLIAAAVLGAAFLTGCASNQGTVQTAPLNNLAFSPVTAPNELVKWSNDKYLDWNLRSIDTYYFQVPDTGSGRSEEQAPTTVSTYQNAAGTGSGAYQSESGAYRLEPYRPAAWH